MFYSHNDPPGEAKRAQMLQSTLAHRASTCGEPDRHDLSAWDAASPLPDKPGAWVWLVLAVLIALNAVLALII